MKLKIDLDLLSICKSIIEQNYSEDDWDEISSSDMFQVGRYVGGYEGAESAFTFSYFKDGVDFWFRLNLDEVQQIVLGNMKTVEIYPSEN